MGAQSPPACFGSQFFERQADPASVEPTGLRFLFDEPDIEEIDAALAELRARRNGTAG